MGFFAVAAGTNATCRARPTSTPHPKISAVGATGTAGAAGAEPMRVRRRSSKVVAASDMALYPTRLEPVLSSGGLFFPPGPPKRSMPYELSAVWNDDVETDAPGPAAHGPAAPGSAAPVPAAHGPAAISARRTVDARGEASVDALLERALRLVDDLEARRVDERRRQSVVLVGGCLLVALTLHHLERLHTRMRRLEAALILSQRLAPP